MSTLLYTQSLVRAAAVLALITVSVPARADDLAQNRGPVGPYDPILTTVGSKSVIAFYEPNSGHCNFRAVVWSTTDVNADSAARFQADLHPRQVVRIDTAENKSLILQCGNNAEELAIVEAERFADAGAAQ